jgi:hypothetical protein
MLICEPGQALQQIHGYDPWINIFDGGLSARANRSATALAVSIPSQSTTDDPALDEKIRATGRSQPEKST